MTVSYLLARMLPAMLAMVPAVANASWFEFCDMQATIQRSTPDGKGGYDLDVEVRSAQRASERGELSYTNCSEHIGKTMPVSLGIPEGAGMPAPGDVISFSRSSVDEFDKDGAFAGNKVTIEFRELRKGHGQ